MCGFVVLKCVHTSKQDPHGAAHMTHLFSIVHGNIMECNALIVWGFGMCLHNYFTQTVLFLLHDTLMVQDMSHRFSYVHVIISNE